MATNNPTPRDLAHSQEAKDLALMHAAARPQDLLDRTKPLPATVSDNLEDVLKGLTHAAYPDVRPRPRKR